jgi:serine protease AprX
MTAVLAAAAAAGRLSPDLDRRLRAAGDGEFLPVHVVLSAQMDQARFDAVVAGTGGAGRRMAVVRTLKDFVRPGQAAVLEALTQAGARNVLALWIVNAVYCQATPAAIRAVAALPEVSYVNYDLAYAPMDLPGASSACPDEIPWGVQRVRAPEVWAMGYTGRNVVVGLIDTGCDYAHPDLAGQLWADPNYPFHGWDFENNDNDPMDELGHGTSVAGTIAGDGTSGSQCGVAPDAQLMVLRVRTTADSISEAQCWQAMEFCITPPLSPTHGAHLFNLSLGWVLSWGPHEATWRTACNNANAAGLSQFVVAGSEGSGNQPHGLRCPGHVPPPWWNPQNTGVGTLSGVVTNGSTDSSDVVLSMSSQGPVTWDSIAPFNDYLYPPGLTKPDLCAPGQAIKTCRLGGGYMEWSGTSVATPFVAGAAALLLSADSTLSPARIDAVLESTAVDRGPVGKDNTYGAGRIDALAAVQRVAGIEEVTSGELRTDRAAATVVHGAVPRALARLTSRHSVFDASGREVTATSCPAPGVYFVSRAAGSAGGALRVSRVILVR